MTILAVAFITELFANEMMLPHGACEMNKRAHCISGMFLAYRTPPRVTALNPPTIPVHDHTICVARLVFFPIHVIGPGESGARPGPNERPFLVYIVQRRPK